MPPAAYQKVLDDRKRRVRGLWIRNGWFYARLNIVDGATGYKSTRRVSLEAACNVAEANNRIAGSSDRPARRQPARDQAQSAAAPDSGTTSANGGCSDESIVHSDFISFRPQGERSKWSVTGLKTIVHRRIGLNRRL